MTNKNLTPSEKLRKKLSHIKFNKKAKNVTREEFEKIAARARKTFSDEYLAQY